MVQGEAVRTTVAHSVQTHVHVCGCVCEPMCLYWYLHASICASVCLCALWRKTHRRKDRPAHRWRERSFWNWSCISKDIYIYRRTILLWIPILFYLGKRAPHEFFSLYFIGWSNGKEIKLNLKLESCNLHRVSSKQKTAKGKRCQMTSIPPGKLMGPQPLPWGSSFTIKMLFLQSLQRPKCAASQVALSFSTRGLSTAQWSVTTAASMADMPTTITTDVIFTLVACSSNISSLVSVCVRKCPCVFQKRETSRGSVEVGGLVRLPHGFTANSAMWSRISGSEL